MFHCVVLLVVQIREEAGGAAGRNLVAPEIPSEHAHTLGLQLRPALDTHFEEPHHASLAFSCYLSTSRLAEPLCLLVQVGTGSRSEKIRTYNYKVGPEPACLAASACLQIPML